MEWLSIIGISMGVLGFILGIINSILLYYQNKMFNNQNELLSKQIERDRPIIFVSKIRRGSELPKPRKQNEAVIRIAIKNVGYRSTSLNKIIIMVNPPSKEPYAIAINSLSKNLPLEISSLKMEKLDIYFNLDPSKFLKVLKKKHPIKISMRFIFTHKEIKGNFLIGKKGFKINKNLL